jgi:hypothetical protein
MIDEIVRMLRPVQRIDMQDIRNKFLPQSAKEERELSQAFWKACQILRLEEGIDFGPLRGWPGVYERKDWSQIEQRAKRQRAKGTRAHRRAAERMRLAAELAPDQSKERLADAADRLEVKNAFRRRRSG